VIDVSHDLMPPQYPNVDQVVLLCHEGVRDPVVCALTIVSMVEGFGAIIRDVRVPTLDELLVEPMEGTALAHLREGLFEAHARDEASWGEQRGHKQMWEAARDLAFENPKIPPDVLMRIMGGGAGRRNRGRKRKRLFPQVDEKLESMIATMSNVLIVELFAEEVFPGLLYSWISASPANPNRQLGRTARELDSGLDWNTTSPAAGAGV
jgi:hypothetical protein